MAQQVQEQGAGKRFSSWFRRNEKIFWIALLVFVSVSFGATYIMSEVISDRQKREGFCTVAGLSYSVRDIERSMKWYAEISRMVPQLGLQGLMGNPFQRDADDRDSVRGFLVPFFAAVQEAKDLGIQIPPKRLSSVVGEAFKEGRARDIIEDNTRYMDAKDQGEYYKKEGQAIRDGVTWSEEAYRAWLERRSFSVYDYERAIEKLLQVQALRELFMGSDVISRKDLYETFVRDGRKLKLAVATLDADRFRDEVKVEYKPEELKAYYGDHREDFVLPDRVDFEYLKFPLAHFEAAEAPNEEDVKKRYERDRDGKYLANPAVPPPAPLLPLTPQELKEEEQARTAFYKPLEAVRATIEAELRREGARRRSAEFASDLGQKLSPRPPAPGSDQAAPPKASTPRELVDQHTFVSHGTTPEFTAANAKALLGDVHSESAVNRWFGELKEGKELWRPATYLTYAPRDGDKAIEEKTVYFLVVAVAGKRETRLDWDQDTEKCAALARDKLTRDAATKKARERSEDLINKLREGATMAAATAGLPVQVEVTEPLGRQDMDEFKRKDGERFPPDIEGRIFMSFFATLPLEERVLRPALEEKTPAGDLRFFVAAIEQVVEEPDASTFDADAEKNLRMRLEWTLRRERMQGGWAGYLKGLAMKHVSYAGRAAVQAQAE